MKKNIEIKEPCTENWDQMTPTQQGAFCKKCSLEVQDFTKKSADEIRSVLALNLGGKMCGKISPGQLDTLNADFELWKMNSKRSFQSALIFSLVVAFGFTLFSCEEEEEQKKIEVLQQVGNSYLESQARSSYQVDSISEQPTTQQSIPVKEKADIHQVPFPIDVEEIEIEILGEVTSEEMQPLIQYHIPLESQLYGGMSYSADYFDHITTLEESKYAINNHSKVEEELEFKAFTFPNPAIEQTTLRIILPKKTKVQVDLFTMNSQLIQTISTKRLKKGENNFPIDLLDLPTGTYLISIRSEDFKESVRFVKM
ncbi:MAG: hypothetical protein ACI837_002446 [Crocinitomicaceae bacterium]|jgi:hypothetical protein